MKRTRAVWRAARLRERVLLVVLVFVAIGTAGILVAPRATAVRVRADELGPGAHIFTPDGTARAATAVSRNQRVVLLVVDAKPGTILTVERAPRRPTCKTPAESCGWTPTDVALDRRGVWTLRPGDMVPVRRWRP